MTSAPPITLRSTVWDWSRTYVLGVLNVTPDSFSDAGRYPGVEAAVARALSLIDEGADAIDIGGESTRPGAHAVSLDEELARTVPVVEALAARVAVPISIDTTKCAVAIAALDAGATIVNDVGMGDPPEALGAIAAGRGAAYIAMHARGTPDTMRSLAVYADVRAEVAAELRARASRLEAAGLPRARIILDPGVGFAKTAAQSLELLTDLAPLRALGYALCVGPSRKSFIDTASAYAPSWGVSATDPSARLGGTAAAVALAVFQGAEVVRVHDVAVMRQAARVAHACRALGARHA